MTDPVEISLLFVKKHAFWHTKRQITSFYCSFWVNLKMPNQRSSKGPLKSIVWRILHHSVRHSDPSNWNFTHFLSLFHYFVLLSKDNSFKLWISIDVLMPVNEAFLKVPLKNCKKNFFVFLCIKMHNFWKRGVKSQLNWSLCHIEWSEILQTLDINGHLNACWWGIFKFTKKEQ